jgi:hypothetical protein
MTDSTTFASRAMSREKEMNAAFLSRVLQGIVITPRAKVVEFLQVSLFHLRQEHSDGEMRAGSRLAGTNAHDGVV